MKKLLFFLLFPCALFAQFEEVDWEHGHPEGLVFHEVIEATNGFIVSVGETKSISKQKQDGLVVIRDFTNGTIIKQKTFGGSGNDILKSVVQTYEGYFILAGYSDDEWGKGKKDGWLIKINEQGDIIWRDFYGTPENDEFHKIKLYLWTGNKQ